MNKRDSTTNRKLTFKEIVKGLEKTFKIDIRYSQKLRKCFIQKHKELL